MDGGQPIICGIALRNELIAMRGGGHCPSSAELDEVALKKAYPKGFSVVESESNQETSLTERQADLAKGNSHPQ